MPPPFNQPVKSVSPSTSRSLSNNTLCAFLAWHCSSTQRLASSLIKPAFWLSPVQDYYYYYSCEVGTAAAVAVAYKWPREEGRSVGTVRMRWVLNEWVQFAVIIISRAASENYPRKYGLGIRGDDGVSWSIVSDHHINIYLPAIELPTFFPAGFTTQNTIEEKLAPHLQRGYIHKICKYSAIQQKKKFHYCEEGPLNKFRLNIFQEHINLAATWGRKIIIHSPDVTNTSYFHSLRHIQICSLALPTSWCVGKVSIVV